MIIALLNFSGSLATIVNTPGHTKYISLNNQQYMNQSTTLINFRPKKYIERLSYCPFPLTVDRFTGSCSTLFIISNKVYASTKTKVLSFTCF